MATFAVRSHPKGVLLRCAADWKRRHALVCLVALAHTPVLLAIAVATGAGAASVLAPLPVLVLLAVASGPFGQRTRTVTAATALLLCTVVLVGLLPQHPELAAHLPVVVALIALYQNWSVLSLALLGAAAQPTFAWLLHDRPTQGSYGWVWALVQGVLVGAEAVVLGAFWDNDHQAQTRDDRLGAALREGQASIRARLEETERIRADLIGTVSHEFRTPLTSIRGAALTLLKRGDRLDPASRQSLLHGMLDQQERLSRLLENMLTAARATKADPTAVAEVDAVAAEVAMLAGATRPRSPAVVVLVERGTVALIDRQALHQVLANLVDNAQQHGAPGAVPLITGGHDADGIWIAVSNEGGPLEVTASRSLFEPFTQGDASATRPHEGLGMGLYVVRRLVEVYGGWVTVRAGGGWVTVEVRLRSGSVQAPADVGPVSRRAVGQTAAPTAFPIT